MVVAQTSPADAAATAVTKSGWVQPTSSRPAGRLTTQLHSRPITTGDVGKTIALRLAPDASANLECATQTLGYTRPGRPRVVVERNWFASGCWTGGSNIVVMLTKAMVGTTLSVNGYAAPKSGAKAFGVTGQVTIGSQVQKSSVRLSPKIVPAKPAPKPAVKPAPKPAAKPAPKPTVKPTVKPAPKPVNTVLPKPTGKAVVPNAKTVSLAPGSVPASSLKSLKRIPWEGGAAYYAKFPDTARGGWTNPNHFPIALWWGQASTEAELRHDLSQGINAYVVTNPNTNYRLFEKTGMDYIGHRLPGQPRTSKAWVGDFLDDEVDGRFSATAGPAELDKFAKAMPDHNKFRYANYTGMVISWQSPSWAASSRRYVNGWTDAVSLDTYWYSSPQCGWSEVHGGAYLKPFTKANCRTAQNYGRTTAALRQQDATDGKLQPVWNFVENIDVAPNGKTEFPLAASEVRGAAISSLIHEARGLIWFNNSFGGSCASGNAIRTAQTRPGYACSHTVNAMGEVNRFVQKLAPVLNTQSYGWSYGAGVETMTKHHNGAVYVFAMPTDAGAKAGPGTKTFTVPASLKGKKVSVVGENRSLAMSARGTFTDTFTTLDSYHVYRIG